MKKIKPTKLALTTETIKILDDSQLPDVVGGYLTQLSCIGCTGYPGCPNYSVNPCASPTDGLCVTYVQATCNRC